MSEPTDYDKQRAEREARIAEAKAEVLRTKRVPKTPEMRAKVLENRRANMKKAREAREAIKRQRELIRGKVEAGMPITDEENELLLSQLNKKQTRQKQQEHLLAAASKLLIQPANVKELRVLVERLAQKHSYNPLEELILLTKPQKDATGQEGYLLNAKDRVDIHKALLPYLTPQLKVAPVKEPDPEVQGVKVTIQRFDFPEDRPKGEKIFEQPRITAVTAEPAPATPPA